MKIPEKLIPLVEDGVLDEVLGQIKSGKEADVFVVRVGEQIRCAKVYKDANNRSFRQAAQYQEGRQVKGSRTARAMAKRTGYGQKQAESSWMNAEVAALNVLSAAGLRVPEPFGLFDGVLVMELIVGVDGQVAPRLDDLILTSDQAIDYHEDLIHQVVRMLCAGYIHGDLSEFNVLVDHRGPVIIDLPQAVNAAGNNSAAMLFARDVDNLARFFGRFEPAILGLGYAKEIWALYEKGKLTPDVELTGQYVPPAKSIDVGGVLRVIGEVQKDRDYKVEKNREHAAEKKAERTGKAVPKPADGMLHRIEEPDDRGRGNNRPDRSSPHSQSQPQSQRSSNPQSTRPTAPPKDIVDQWGRRNGPGRGRSR
jgi:RIO kinase 1